MTEAKSTIPTKFQLARPILELLSDGEVWTRAKLRPVMTEILGLSADQCAETVKSGKARIEVRTNWALHHLVAAGAVTRVDRGEFTISDRGRNLLAKHPDEITDADLFPPGRGNNGGEGFAAWFVGAVFGDELGAEAYDHTEIFVESGGWRAGPGHKYSEHILQMEPGDRIAIKAAFTRKRDLPFDIDGKTASVMAIKATGTITSNPGDGDSVEVDWDSPDLLPEEDWYFWTSRNTVWMVQPGIWTADALLRFTFDGLEQDYDRFLRAPYWRKKYFGDESSTTNSPAEPADVSASEEVPDELVYSIDDILTEGSFATKSELAGYLDALTRKKNLILQGPPGTGKTWLAKRLAYAMVGRKDKELIRSLQFHPTVSYEDFVRGWRPSGDGKLSLTDGVFLESIDAALNEPDRNHVLVIEEINRANLAQVMGELLTLLEADKRKPSEAIALTYSRADEEPVFIPGNLYIIGTMNLADRSLAIVDFALRRRFAFADLSPQFNEAWRQWVSTRNKIDSSVLATLAARIEMLNTQIAGDRSLGPQYCIGHSFFTPANESRIDDPAAWIRNVVDQEIGSLLGEYWFDDPERVETEIAKLIGAA